MNASRFNAALCAIAVMTMSVMAQAQNQVIYTGEIGKKVIGYNGPTPLNITITGGKISKIEVLDNEESPRYLDKATAKVFPQFIGKTVKQALNVKADGATGATYTSEALIQNIRLGLQQAQTSGKAAKKAAKKGKKAGKVAKKAQKKAAKRAQRAAKRAANK